MVWRPKSGWYGDLGPHYLATISSPLLSPPPALLLTAQLHNARQLSSWCLHFVASNYVVFEPKEEFSLLAAENLDYVNDHRWPPLSYEKAIEEYRQKYEGEEECEGEAGAGAGAKRGRGRGRDKCRVM